MSPITAPPLAKAPSSPALVIVLTFTTLLLLAAAVYFAWLLMGVPAGTEADAHVFGAVLGLVGVVVTAVISLSGMVLKDSIDRRTLAIEQQSADVAVQAELRLGIEALHNRDMAHQAEARLRLDTAIKAVELMSVQNGVPAPAAQKAGALFALVTLNQMDFALALLERLWAAGEIDSPSAIWIVERALAAGRPAQREAVHLLDTNVEKLLDTKQGFFWPSSIALRWNPGYPLYVRERLLVVLVKLLHARRRDEWELTFLLPVVVLLHSAMTLDAHPRVRAASAAALRRLLDDAELRELDEVYVEDSEVSLAKAREAAYALKAEQEQAPDKRFHLGHETLSLIRALGDWRYSASPP